MDALQMEDLIKQICEDNSIKCKVRIQFSRYTARYNYEGNTIYFNPDRCLSMASRMNLSIEEFITFTTYHEIGHYLDHIKGNKSGSIIEREIAAWKLSRYLVSIDSLKLYDEFNQVNLESYVKRYS